jgi:hypothetical protein
MSPAAEELFRRAVARAHKLHSRRLHFHGSVGRIRRRRRALCVLLLFPLHFRWVAGRLKGLVRQARTGRKEKRKGAARLRRSPSLTSRWPTWPINLARRASG